MARVIYHPKGLLIIEPKEDYLDLLLLSSGTEWSNKIYSACYMKNNEYLVISGLLLYDCDVTYHETHSTGDIELSFNYNSSDVRVFLYQDIDINTSI